MYALFVVMKFNSHEFWNQILWLALNIFRFCVVVVSCSWCSKQANSSANIVHRLMIKAKGQQLEEVYMCVCSLRFPQMGSMLLEIFPVSIYILELDDRMIYIYKQRTHSLIYYL